MYFFLQYFLGSAIASIKVSAITNLQYPFAFYPVKTFLSKDFHAVLKFMRR